MQERDDQLLRSWRQKYSSACRAIAPSHMRARRTSCSVLLIFFLFNIGYLATRVFAHAPVPVSNEEELRQALANVAVDAICVDSSFVISGTELLIARSINVTACCGASAGGLPGCTLTLGTSSLSTTTSALRIQADARAAGIFVHVEGVEFAAAKRLNKDTGSADTALECGGAQASVLRLKNVLFRDFNTSRGVLSILGVGCAVTCTNCTFDNNKAVEDGGAAYVTFGSFACCGCAFTRNRASRGGAVFVGTGGHAELHHAFFSENVAEVGGFDVFIEQAPFAALTYCPDSSHPDAMGSPRLPVGSRSCAEDTSMSCSPTGSSSTPAQGDLISGIPGMTPGMLSPSFTELSPGSSGLLLYTLSGMSQVPAGYPFSLRAVIVLSEREVEDVMLDLVIGHEDGHGVGCSGFFLDAVHAKQGTCVVLGSGAAGCNVSCHLGQVQWTSPPALDLTLRAVTLGAQLAVEATELMLGHHKYRLPVWVMQASRTKGEPIHVIDARQPVIAPASGAVGSLKPLLGSQRAAVFVGTSEVLSFQVIGPGLGRCNATHVIVVEGPAQVMNVTAGEGGEYLLAFAAVTTPDSAIVLQVVAAACVGTDGQASIASEPLPVLVDLTRPSVSVTSAGGKHVNDPFTMFHIQFSEWVSGFSEDGIDVIGGYIICLMAINETEGTYEAAVKHMKGVHLVSFSVKENAAVDIVGNPSTASNLAKHEYFPHRALLTKLISGLLQFAIVFSLVAIMMKDGPGLGRLVAFVGHVQFFQMISFLDIPLDNTLGDILHDLAWVNNGWSRHPFSSQGSLSQDFGAFDGGGPGRSLPGYNGSCHAHTAGGLHPDVDGSHLDYDLMGRRLLADTAGGGWPRMTFAELSTLVHNVHSHVPAPEAISEDGFLHLNTPGDVWGVFIYSGAELAACVAARAFGISLWRVVSYLWPRPFWRPPPAILLFPRLELLVLLLTFPTMTQACVFYATSGFEWGALIGACVGAAYPLAFVTFVFWFIISKILVKEECTFRGEKIFLLGYPSNAVSFRGWNAGMSNLGASGYGRGQDSMGVAASHREPLLLDAAWFDREASGGRDLVRQYGLLFQDLKGPTSFDAPAPTRERPMDQTGPARASSSQSSSSRSRSLSMDIWLSQKPEGLCEWTPEPSHLWFPTRCLPRWRCLMPATRRVTHGHLSASYMLLILFKQFLFAALTGVSYRHLRLPHLGSVQVSFMVAWLVFHVAYLIIVQPYISRLMHATEIMVMICELGSLSCCLALAILDKESAEELKGTFSSIILLFFFLAMSASLLQLWWGMPRLVRNFWHSARLDLPLWIHGHAGRAYSRRSSNNSGHVASPRESSLSRLRPRSSSLPGGTRGSRQKNREGSSADETPWSGLTGAPRRIGFSHGKSSGRSGRQKKRAQRLSSVPSDSPSPTTFSSNWRFSTDWGPRGPGRRVESGRVAPHWTERRQGDLEKEGTSRREDYPEPAGSPEHSLPGQSNRSLSHKSRSLRRSNSSTHPRGVAHPAVHFTEISSDLASEGDAVGLAGHFSIQATSQHRAQRLHDGQGKPPPRIAGRSASSSSVPGRGSGSLYVVGAPSATAAALLASEHAEGRAAPRNGDRGDPLIRDSSGSHVRHRDRPSISSSSSSQTSPLGRPGWGENCGLIKPSEPTHGVAVVVGATGNDLVSPPCSPNYIASPLARLVPTLDPDAESPPDVRSPYTGPLYADNHPRDQSAAPRGLVGGSSLGRVGADALSKSSTRQVSSTRRASHRESSRRGERWWRWVAGMFVGRHDPGYNSRDDHGYDSRDDHGHGQGGREAMRMTVTSSSDGESLQGEGSGRAAMGSISSTWGAEACSGEPSRSFVPYEEPCKGCGGQGRGAVHISVCGQGWDEQGREAMTVEGSAPVDEGWGGGGEVGMGFHKGGNDERKEEEVAASRRGGAGHHGMQSVEAVATQWQTPEVHPDAVAMGAGAGIHVPSDGSQPGDPGSLQVASSALSVFTADLVGGGVDETDARSPPPGGLDDTIRRLSIELVNLSAHLESPSPAHESLAKELSSGSGDGGSQRKHRDLSVLTRASMTDLVKQDDAGVSVSPHPQPHSPRSPTSPGRAFPLILEGAKDHVTIIRRCSTSQQGHLVPTDGMLLATAKDSFGLVVSINSHCDDPDI